MRPHVFVNVAMSADGKLSTKERRQVRISGETDFRRVDLIKSECDAIMVGIGTVLADDPSLTVKDALLKKRDWMKAGMNTPPSVLSLTAGRGHRWMRISFIKVPAEGSLRFPVSQLRKKPLPSHHMPTFRCVGGTNRSIFPPCWTTSAPSASGRSWWRGGRHADRLPLCRRTGR